MSPSCCCSPPGDRRCDGFGCVHARRYCLKFLNTSDLPRRKPPVMGFFFLRQSICSVISFDPGKSRTVHPQDSSNTLTHASLGFPFHFSLFEWVPDRQTDECSKPQIDTIWHGKIDLPQRVSRENTVIYVWHRQICSTCQISIHFIRVKIMEQQ